MYFCYFTVESKSEAITNLNRYHYKDFLKFLREERDGLKTSVFTLFLLLLLLFQPELSTGDIDI